MEEKNQSFLGESPIGRLMLKYAVPCVISLLVGALYNIVDQIFIANADYLGSYGNAANTVVFPLTVIALAVAVMIGDGCCAFVSIHLGKGEKDKARRSVGNSVVLAVILGIVLAAIYLIFDDLLITLFGGTVSDETFRLSKEYFLYISLGIPFYMFGQALNPIIRADGNPQYMMRSMMIGAALNVVLDPIFIFVFRWGIQGAALATIIGQIVSGVIALAYLPRFSHFAIRKKYLRLKWRFIGDIVRLGFPSLCTQTATAATQIVMNNLMRKYGAATIYGSEIALSCYGLMMKIYQIAHAMFVGLASGTQPINGFNFGARQYERVKQTIQTAAKISIGISVLWFLVFRYGGGFLAALFVEEEPLYQEFAVHCFRLYMMGFFVYGLPNVTASFFQAIGSPVKSLAVSLSRQVIFLIPFALLLSAHFGMDGALGAAPVADVLAFLLAALLLKRELRGWKKKNMTA
mgnify:CR=1 FL=1